MKNITEYDRIIWDFNGTILDDLYHGIASVNALLSRRGLPLVDSLERYYSLFGFPIEAYYRKLGLLDNEPYDSVAFEWLDEYRKGEKDLGARRGVPELLSAIKEAGVKQSVLSATESTMLHQQIGYLKFDHYFDSLLGREDIFATNKSGIAIAFRQSHPTERVLMIGDTDHDYETAKAASFDCVLVGGGHQSLDYLMTLGCDTVPDFETLKGCLFADGMDH